MHEPVDRGLLLIDSGDERERLPHGWSRHTSLSRSSLDECIIGYGQSKLHRFTMPHGHLASSALMATKKGDEQLASQRDGYHCANSHFGNDPYWGMSKIRATLLGERRNFPRMISYDTLVRNHECSRFFMMISFKAGWVQFLGWSALWLWICSACFHC